MGTGPANSRVPQWRGPCEIYKFYNTPRADMLVGYAIVHNIISEDSVTAELAPCLERQNAFYRNPERQNQAGSPSGWSNDDEEMEE